MNSSFAVNDLFAYNSENVHQYKRNFLSRVVCEFRFPTLMELGESKPPASFVKALRKEYPVLELSNEVTLGPGSGMPDTNNAHILKASKGNWIVSLKKNSFSVETKNYTTHAKMSERIADVLRAVLPIIDTEIFTRIGLRYINDIIVDEDPSDGWIASELVAPLQSTLFTGVRDFAGQLVTESEEGGFLLQHKLKLQMAPQGGEISAVPSYAIDIDVYRNEVEVADAIKILDEMHHQAFNLFDWSAGPKLREHLKKSKQ